MSRMLRSILSLAMVLMLAGVLRADAGATAPSGLLCELLPSGAKGITDAKPEFAWTLPPGAMQSAYELSISVWQREGEFWNSGKVTSDASVNVEYTGQPLQPETWYAWKVRTWDQNDHASEWSSPSEFRTAAEFSDTTPTLPLQWTEQKAQSSHWINPQTQLLDFGKHAFGYLRLTLVSPDDREITVRLGEKLNEGRLDPKPGGTIRFAEVKLQVKQGRHRYRVETPPDKRNTSGDAILLPERFGVVMPFRYAEIEGAAEPIEALNAHQVRLHYPFEDNASSFHSSSDLLDRIYDLCKYSIKATTSFGVYVDGDRERIPYEADAYLNQLSHYAVDRDFALARYSHEYLLEHPTWPTEWKQHSVLMAHADWMATGNLESFRTHYDVLKREKVLSQYAREDGLLNTHEKTRDIVDWPAGERDGYVMSPINTVVNAFHYRTLVLMGEMAAADGRTEEAASFQSEADRVRKAFNAKLFDTQRGVYVDGEGIDHASIHANLFPLAFGLVPEERKVKVIEFIKSRGMAVSVYPAQYLLEALFENGQADYAIELMMNDSDRGWLNMMRVGSTITLEAWDAKYKPNLDWNHAWGAAPANIIPRYILGVRPLKPGYEEILIEPQLGPLQHASGVVPTIRGPVMVKVFRRDNGEIGHEIRLPGNTTGKLIAGGETRPLVSGMNK